MAFTKIHHVGVVAPNIEEARHLFCDVFGFQVEETRSPLPQGRPASDNVRIIDIPVGESEVEISCPQDTVSGTARFMAERGRPAAIHHICFYSDDIDADVARLRAAGLQQIGQTSSGETGQRVAFFHPKSCLGILIEIWHNVEPKAKA